jgi:hypothetical protein
MSAREAENGFVRERFVSSKQLRRNIRREKENDFNEVKIEGIQARKSFVFDAKASSSPRKAGTHNPGHLLLKEVVDHRAQQYPPRRMGSYVRRDETDA